VLIAVISVSIAIGFLAGYVSQERGGWLPRTIAHHLATTREDSWPNVLNAGLLLASAASFGLCAALAPAAGPLRWRWLMTAGAALLLMVDELTQLHNLATPPVQALAGDWRLARALGNQAWLLLAAPLVALFGLLWLPAIRHLPRHTAWQLAAAAALYAGGYAGLTFLAQRLGQAGTLSVPFLFFHALRELAVMLGLVLLLWAIWQYLAKHWSALEFQFKPAGFEANLQAPAPAAGVVGLNPRAIVTGLGLGVSLFTVLYIGFFIFVPLRDLRPDLRAWLTLIDLDGELNLPATYNGLLLCLVTVLLAAIGFNALRQRDRLALPWLALTAAFSYLTVDELASIHELLVEPMRAGFGLSGLLGFGWYLVALPLVAVLGLVCLDLMRRLPTRTRLLFIFAGGVYVVGSAGLEMVAALIFERLGLEHVVFRIEVAVEETLEMAGLIIFIFALLEYLARRWGAVRVTLAPASL
jgi:hypothetical protein